MTYADRRKRNGADYYGEWHEGRQVQADIISGYTHQWKMLGRVMPSAETSYGKPRP